MVSKSGDLIRETNSAAVLRLFQRSPPALVDSSPCQRSRASTRHRSTLSAAELVGTSAIRRPPRAAWFTDHVPPCPLPSVEYSAVAATTTGRSCAQLQKQIAAHAIDVVTPLDAFPCSDRETQRQQWVAYRHAQAIRRHEKTLPRRRAMDAYLHLTGAQADVLLQVPNAYTAGRLIERNGGRWVIDNTYHQALVQGKPLMTRVMQGEYILSSHPRARASETAKSKQRSRSVNCVAANKRDVRVSSETNAARRSQSTLASERHGTYSCR